MPYLPPGDSATDTGSPVEVPKLILEMAYELSLDVLPRNIGIFWTTGDPDKQSGRGGDRWAEIVITTNK